MRILKILWLILIVSWCNFALAEISPGPSPGKVGELSIVIVASETPDYIREWVSTPAKHGVTIKRLRLIKPNQFSCCSIFSFWSFSEY